MSLVLRHEDIDGLLTVDEVREAVRAGLIEQGEGQVQVPPRITIDSTSNRGWLRVMPAILNGAGVMGYKAMHSTPGVGVRYLVMLYELASGELLAQMDADWLTAQRTAATAAIAADLLAAPEIACAGVLGSSDQARAMLTAVSRIRKIPHVKVYSPTPANRSRFAADMRQRLGVAVTAVDSAQEAASHCDLVLSVYRAGSEPLIEAGWIKAGAHVNAGSSVRPEARELRDDVWPKCSVVAVDDRAHVFESGDGRSVLASGCISPDLTVELWELQCGSRPGRQHPNDITLFKGVGTALQDLALAVAIYRTAKARGLGQDIGNFPRVRR
jgi:ornithine cyclodeaminase/alanine dehydrogenase-like protein (mu-crystallin family)